MKPSQVPSFLTFGVFASCLWHQSPQCPHNWSPSAEHREEDQVEEPPLEKETASKWQLFPSEGDG